MWSVKFYQRGRLHESANGSEESRHYFHSVGPPQASTGHGNTEHVHATSKGIAKAMDVCKIIVTKSTVPVGTGDEIKKWVAEETSRPFAVVTNPEFLKEGGWWRTLKPDRVVLGGDNSRTLIELDQSGGIGNHIHQGQMQKYRHGNLSLTSLSSSS
jgi:UDP-glucose 6-dehydrogenase